jgi:hypothetical protein
VRPEASNWFACRLLFCGCCACGDASELDVIRLQFRRGAKVDLEFIERLAKALDTRFDLRFALLVLLNNGRRRFVSPRGFVNCGNATRDAAEQVNKLGQKLDLVRDAGRALGSNLRYALSRCRRRWLWPCSSGCAFGRTL